MSSISRTSPIRRGAFEPRDAVEAVVMDVNISGGYDTDRVRQVAQSTVHES
jgi:hypothetical protein